MARPDTDGLPADLTGVAAAIGRYLPASGPRLGIAEVLPVWVITLADLRAPGGVANAEDQGLWHLQLRPVAELRAVACARVKDLAGAAEVQAVYRSPLAGDIDDALADADQNYPDDSWRARLLDLPEAHLTLLWLLRPGQDHRLIFLEDAVQGDPGWRKADDLSGTDFRNRLGGLRPILGIEPSPEGDGEEAEAESSDS
jgi:hypothetical protein